MWLASEMAAFAQVCEFKSFTAAARALGVPKVAVSRAILSLERRLGTRLLTPHHAAVAPTPAGAPCYRRTASACWRRWKRSGRASRRRR